MTLRIVLAVHVDIDATDGERHAALIRARKEAYLLQGFCRQYVFDTKVMPLVEQSENDPAPRSRGGDYNLPEMIATYNALPEKFNQPVDRWHIIGGTSSSNCGMAMNPGPASMTFKHCEWPTPAHEVWHTIGPEKTTPGLGHNHKRRLTADGHVNEPYGGAFIMASGGSRVWELIDGAQCAHLGFVESTEITTSQDVLLCPMNLEELGRHPNEIPLAKIGDMCVFTPDGTTVYCTEKTRSRNTIQYAVLNGPGDLVPLLDGLAVEYIESRNATVKVSIVMDSQSPVPVEFPETVLPLIN